MDKINSHAKYYVFTLLCLMAGIVPFWAQKTINQKGRVREITYSSQEELVPVGNVLIKLRGGVTKTSETDGTFLLPVTEYSFFNIDFINPPSQSKYSLIVPTRMDLHNPFKYSSNIFEIILSNKEKRQKEENRIIKNYIKIYNTEKASLELQIKNLNDELKYSQYESESVKQSLSHQIDSLSNILSRIPKEFSRASIQDEVERLVSIDYALLTPEEARKIDLRKEGDWPTFQELVRKNILTPSEMDYEYQKQRRIKSEIKEKFDSVAECEAKLRKGAQAYRDMFESHANMHNCDSAAIYITLLFNYPEYVALDDYSKCSNYVFNHVGDSKQAVEIITSGINRYKDSNDLDSEIKLLLNLAEIEYESGKIHTASAIYAEVEQKLDALDQLFTPTTWYAKSKIGAFCVSIGEIKKGIELMEYCKSSSQYFDISDLDNYEFLSNYVSSLISIGRYSEAEQIEEDLLSQLKPLTNNIFYNEIFAENLCNKANIQSAKGLINESISNYNAAITTYNDIFGKSSRAEVSPRMMIANYQFSTGKFDEAFESLDTITEIINVSYDDPEIPLISVQLSRAKFLNDLAQFKEAENIYHDQIKVLDKHFANQPINMTEAYLGLSKIYNERGEYHQALKILFDCDSLIQQTFPRDGLFRVSTLSGIANVRFALQDYEEAINLLEKTKSITQDMIGSQSLTYENLCVELASYKRQMGFYDEAKSLLSDVQKSRETHPLEIRRMPCLFKVEEINLLSELGDYDEMKSKIDVALQESISIYGESHPTTTNIKSLLAAYYSNVGEIEKAVDAYNECMVLTQKHFSETDILVSPYYKALYELYSLVGDFENAKYCAGKVYETCNKVFGEESINTIQAKLNFISLNSEVYEYKNKINTLNLIIESLNRLGASNSSVTNNVLLQKASLLNDNGHYYEALDIYKDVLRINTAAFGYKHQINIVILSGMAQCYALLLNFKEASRCYEEALVIASEIYGKNNVYYNQIALGYCNFLINNGQYSEALRLAEDIERVTVLTNSKLAQVSSKLNLSLIYAGQEDYNKALHYLDSALELHLAIFKKDNFRTIPIYTQYAQLYYNYQVFGKAMEYYEKADDLAKLFYSEDDDVALGISLGKIRVLIASYRTKEALAIADSVLTKLSSVPNNTINDTIKDVKYFATYMTAADLYKSMGKNKKAIDILNNLYKSITNEPGQEMNATTIKYSIADNECNLMDYNSALKDILIAEDMALGLDSPALLRNIKRVHAEILTFLGRFDEAYEILKEYSAEILDAPNDLNSSSISICNALYSLFSAKQDKKTAARFNEISKEFYKKTMGEDSPYYINLEFSSIINGESIAPYSKNLERMSKLVNTIDSVCGIESRISKNWHFQAALYQYRHEGSLLAAKNLKVCLEALQDMLKEQPNQLAQVYLSVADVYQGFGRIEESKEYLNKSKMIIDQTSDKDSYLYNAVQLPYMKCMISIGDFNEAEASLKKCKDYVNTRYGENSPALLTLLNNEISLCLTRFEHSDFNNDSERVENVIKQFEDIIISAALDFPLLESQINYNKGLLYVKKDMPTLANIYFDKYKEYIINHYGDSSPQLFSYYKFYAGKILQEAFNYKNLNNNKLSEAETLTDKILKMAEELFGLDTPMNIDVYQIYANLQIIKYHQTHDSFHLDEALTKLDECLKIINDYLGDSPTKYNILTSKLQTYLLYEDFENAEDVLNKQYDLAMRIWGEESYNVYSTKSGYAHLCMMREDYDEAAEIYREALDFLFKYNSFETEKINMLHVYATALYNSGQFETAKIQLERALKLIEDSDNPNQYNQIRSTIQQSINSF